MSAVLLSPIQSFKSFRSAIYDSLAASMTTVWYRDVLSQCPMDASILDVGIGTATSLVANRDILHSKRLLITGVDYDGDYIHTAREKIRVYGLEEHIRVVHCGIMDYEGGPFDVVYFSGSFMIIPNKVEVLRHCCRMLRHTASNGNDANKNGSNADACGTVCFTQTFEKPTLFGLFVAPLVKGLLKIVTTIDFGQVTYERDFMSVLKTAGVSILSMQTVRESYFRKEVVVVAKPE